MKLRYFLTTQNKVAKSALNKTLAKTPYDFWVIDSDDEFRRVYDLLSLRGLCLVHKNVQDMAEAKYITYQVMNVLEFAEEQTPNPEPPTPGQPR